MRASSIIAAVQGVTKRWAKQRKAEERHAHARANRADALRRRNRVTVKDAAWEIMERAYMQASADGALPANARQIMYAGRPYIMRRTGRALDDQYFTQTLLPDYVNENNIQDWDVVYDDRGHFREPHSTELIGLGTLSVRDYLRAIEEHDPPRPLDIVLPEPTFPTRGPQHRFGAILYIEKEGFMPLFDSVRLADRFDIAIMSSKGMSVTAARLLADQLCGRSGVPLLILHDFDKSGFSIRGTLERDTRRYAFVNAIERIDLGLRIGDIAGLQTEPVHHKADRAAVIANLRDNGASNDEIAFLLQRRVELNAMTSPQLVAFVERKLIAAGVAKVIPERPILEQACRRAQMHLRLTARLDSLRAEIEWEVAVMPLPKNLLRRVRAILAEHPELPWEAAVCQIVESSAGE
jgi:hypothetical protein